MPIHDISLTLTPDIPTWDDELPISLERVMKMEEGDPLNLTRIASMVHIGTHVDAPMHYVADGTGVNTLDLEALIGPALVVAVPDVDLITAAVLDTLNIPIGTTRLLLKTRNSDLWARGETAFQRDYVALDTGGAEWLVAHGVRAIGIDYLSVATYDDLTQPHVVLLQAGVIPIEGLNLAEITPGPYQLVCLPVKLGAYDGAPARAVLIS